MEKIKNTIDVQHLAISQQDEDNTYIGLDENGQLVRTKISLNADDYYTKDDVDERIAQEIFEEVTRNKISFISGDESKGFRWGDYSADVVYATINNESILTEWDEKKNFQLETKEDANTKYNDLSGTLSSHNSHLESLARNIQDIRTAKWTISSGNDYISANYGDTKYGELKTINGVSIVGDANIQLPSMTDYNDVKNNIDEIEDDVRDLGEKVERVDKSLSNATFARLSFISGDGYEATYFGQSKEVYFKTINGESIIEDGNIQLPSLNDYNDVKNTIDDLEDEVERVSKSISNATSSKLSFISGNGYDSTYFGDSDNIYFKTINGNSIIGDGDIIVTGEGSYSFKTINGESIVGEGDITIQGGNVQLKTINGISLLGNGDIDFFTETGHIEWMEDVEAGISMNTPYVFNIINTQWETTPNWSVLKGIFDSGKPMIMRYTTEDGDVNICRVLGWSDTQFWAVGRWTGLSDDGICMYYGYPDRVFCYSKIVLQAELDFQLSKITSQIGDINNILESI